MSIETRPACRICGYRDHWLGDHVVSHGHTLESYLQKYPQAPMMSSILGHRASPAKNVARQHPPSIDSLTVNFAGREIPVNADVPDMDCLTLPPSYRIPQWGALGEDIKDVAIPMAKRRSIYIWGPKGTGKDAVVHALSAYTRSPAKIFQMQPSIDIQSWFFSHEFNKDGTFWYEGDLLKILRDGYLTTTGRRIPYIVLITDFDRATKEQAESMRLVLDSIEGRVPGPNGTMHSVFPGTMVIVTANTSGGGDATGHYVSSNILDSSLLDRFERCFEFHSMDWRDETEICAQKFPALVKRMPDILTIVGNVVTAIRAAVLAQSLYMQFSHRAVCAWLSAATDILEDEVVVPNDLLTRSFRTVADRAPDKETRNALMLLMDPHVKGGTLPKARR